MLWKGVTMTLRNARADTCETYLQPIVTRGFERRLSILSNARRRSLREVLIDRG